MLLSSLRILRWIILVISVLFSTACFHSSGNEAVGIEIEAESHLVWQLNTPYQLHVKAIDSSGEKTKNQPEFVWSSLDETVATVDQDGIVTALKEGTVVIRATGGKFSQDIELLVDTRMQDVSLQIRYEDRLYNKTGFVATKMKPVRFVKVEFVNEGKHFITDGRTDSTGRVTASIPQSGDVAVRVISELKQEKVLLSVQDMSGSYYSVYKNLDMAQADELLPVNITLETKVAGAFNILDVYSVASEFTHSFNSLVDINVTTYWETDNNSGTFYCINGEDPACIHGRGIYVLSIDGGDTDEFDDDVLWHEYGHYIASAVSRDDSPGGCHYFDMNDLDLRLSWSEGWGDFFPMAVKSWAAENADRADYVSMDGSVPQTFYVDTSAGEAQLSFDVAKLADGRIVETADGNVPFEDFHVHASSELAVSKILWDTLSSPSYGMAGIWGVVDEYLDTVDASVAINLETFWDGLLETKQPDSSDLADLQQIFNERKVFYQLDQYEDNDGIDAAQAISLGSEQTHHLYSGTSDDDADVVSVDLVFGKSYEVLTKGLTNGADTHIRILDDLGAVVSIDGQELANDDWRPHSEYEYSLAGCGYIVSNNKTALSSRIVFTAPETARYYIEVRSTAFADPPPFPSAGRYGSYDLKVSDAL